MYKNLNMTVFSTSILLVLTLMVGNIGISNAAEPIEPPFEDSLKQRYAVVMAEQTGSDNSAGRFKIKQVLWDPRKQVNIDDDVSISNFSHFYSDIQNKNKSQSDCHILVISRFRKHPLFRDQIIDNPDGMAIQQLPAVGPAVFHCSDEITRTYAKIIDERQNDAKPDTLHDLMTLAESDDLQSHRLAAFELSMHRDWMQEANADNAEHLQRLIKSERLSAETNEMLIQAARGLPQQLYQDWFRDYLLGVLNANPPTQPYELASFTPLLVRSSLLTMKDLSLASESDWDNMTPFLYSNAPGVAKAALSLLDDLDAERFRKESQALLADNDKSALLHTETRRALEAHLRQTAAL